VITKLIINNFPGYCKNIFFEPFIIKLAPLVNTGEKSLLIDVKKFCHDVIQGANKWLKENEN